MPTYNTNFILIDLILTILFYCTIPVILRLKNGKYEYEKGRKIVLINCIIVCICFMFIRLASGAEQIISPTVFLYYYIDKAILLKPKNETEDETNSVEGQTNSTDNTTNNVEIIKEYKTNPTNKNRSKKTIYVCISIFVITLICLGIYAVNLSNKSNELDKATTKSQNNNQSVSNNTTNPYSSQLEDEITQAEFESKRSYLESIATEIWITGDMDGYLFSEIIITKDSAYRLEKLYKNSPMYVFYEIKFKRHNNTVEVSYVFDNKTVTFNGKIFSKRLELYSKDGSIYSDYTKVK